MAVNEKLSFCPVEGTQCTVISCNEFVQRVQDLQIEKSTKISKMEAGRKSHAGRCDKKLCQ